MVAGEGDTVEGDREMWFNYLHSTPPLSLLLSLSLVHATNATTNRIVFLSVDNRFLYSERKDASLSSSSLVPSALRDFCPILVGNDAE